MLNIFKNKKYIFFIIVIVITLVSLSIFIYCNNLMPQISPDMLSPRFWINNTPDAKYLIMTKKEISDFNKKNYDNPNTLLYDLKSFPATISKESLINYLKKIEIPKKDRYIGNTKVTSSYYDNYTKNINLAEINDITKVGYAYCVKRANIRTFPTTDESLESPGDTEFDMFQESVLETAEPLIVLHHSKDNKWYFIQSTYCTGWVQSNYIAISKTKKQWLEYYNSSNFLIVCSNKLKLPYNPYSPEISELELAMGAKLQLVNTPETPTLIDNQISVGNYIVKIPTIDLNKNLAFKNALIPISSDVSIGYLPYTRENIIKQAFKIQGSRYGWGGMFNSRDCSAFIVDVFKTFGITLPRNTSKQELSYGQTTEFDSVDKKLRYSILDNASPGALLLMNNHVMLYLGKYNGKHYIIHSLYAYGDKNKIKPNGDLNAIIVNANVVTDVDLPLRRKGLPIVNALKLVKQIEYPEPTNNLVNIKNYSSDFIIDLKYASTDNFTHQKLYSRNECYLQKDTVWKLIDANNYVKKYGYQIKIWDGYRPYSVQKTMWELVPNSQFVANPYKGGSNHNKGCAVDVTLVDIKTGKEAIMPSKFDDFTQKSSRHNSNMPIQANNNLKILTDAMLKSGFKSITSEWWHYDDCDSYKYDILDINLVSLSNKRLLVEDITNITRSNQVILVKTKYNHSYKGKLYTYERINGKWMEVFPEMDAGVGMNGFKPFKNIELTSSDKKIFKYEGDKFSPAGIFTINSLFGWGENQSFKLKYRKVTDNDYWLSENAKDLYNVWVTKNDGPDKTWKNYEKLKIDLYKYAGIINYNIDKNRIVGNGSAIFLHILGNTGYTSGCTAVSEENLIKIFKWLDTKKKPVIVQGSESQLSEF